jgi:hypothetical protein
MKKGYSYPMVVFDKRFKFSIHDKINTKTYYNNSIIYYIIKKGYYGFFQSNVPFENSKYNKSK